MLFKVYQTFDNRGEENRSEIISQMGIFGDTTDLFLGRGYYYWENSDDSIIWGERHYKGNYSTIAGVLDLDMNLLFDLTYYSNILSIQKLIKDYKREKRHRGNMYLGMFIDIIRSIQEEALAAGKITAEERPFPYLYSRAIDNTKNPATNELGEFANRGNVHHYYHTKPVGFFCVYDKKDLNLSQISVIRSRVNVL